MFDYDFIVIGSGFGGSVAGHRLTEKGYSVAILEMGKRYRTEDLPSTNWQVGKALWAPKLGLYGTFGISVLRNLVVFHGAGVGGGSLVYANIHAQPPDDFFRDFHWKRMGFHDFKRDMEPFYRTARFMLGSTEPPKINPWDTSLREVLTELGQGGTFRKHQVGVYFGEPGVRVPDPYFGGEGPDRVGCTFHGGCIVGCRVGAKNTLDKNYLYFAEKHGARIIPETRVVDIRPIGKEDGSQGYLISAERTTSLLRRRRFTLTAQNVVLAAGVLGTVKLLASCHHRGSLPCISAQLGNHVRTNSESIQAILTRDKNLGDALAITSGGHADETTHIELFRLGPSADALSSITTVHVGGGPLARQLYFLRELARHPLRAVMRIIWPFGWSRRVIGVLAMQKTDNYMRLRYRRRWYWPFGRVLSGDWADGQPPQRHIEVGDEVTQRLSRKLNGTPLSILPEVLFNTSTTAHLLGGAVMASDAKEGVVDQYNRAFHYQGLYVVDASMIPANLGVNPSLTITALAERAMSSIPAKRDLDSV